MKLHTATGIVLRLTKLTDTSLIVTWFTDEFGKLKTVAKGARRPKSPFLGKLDLFRHNELVFYQSRASDLHILKECALISDFPRLRSDFATMARASYLCELVDLTTEVETPTPQLFEALQRGFAELEETAPARGVERDPTTVSLSRDDRARAGIAVRRFEMALFKVLGHEPRLCECAKCREPLTGTVFFSAQSGGGVCPRCAAGVTPKFKVEADTLRVLKELTERPTQHGSLTEIQLAESERIAAAMLKEVLGIWPKSRQFISG